MPFPVQWGAITDRIRALFGARGRLIFQADETIVPVVIAEDLSGAPWRGTQKVSFRGTFFVDDDGTTPTPGLVVGLGIQDAPGTNFALQPKKNQRDLAVITHLSFQVEHLTPTIISTNGIVCAIVSAAHWATNTNAVTSVNHPTQATDRPKGFVTDSAYDPRVPVLIQQRAPNVGGFPFPAAQMHRSIFAPDTGSSTAREGGHGQQLLPGDIVIGRGQVIYMFPSWTQLGRTLGWVINVAGFYYPAFQDLQ